ncbi:MAG: GNAT family N-acetyltransferase [Pyrinomonadaceae bacterium]|nr:GNAT family N-acetyltransferase [Sphingobacteriaceae bacterium]
MTSTTQVRRLETNDAAEVASLHYNSFKDFFLTSLGKGFLKVFYQAVLSHKNGLGVGLYVGSDLAGFAIGTKNSTGFYKSLVYSNGLAMCLAAMPRLILDPFKIKRLLIPLWAGNNTNYLNSPSLLSICVSPNYESRGFGKQLLKEFEIELIDNHCLDVLLSTDSHNNDYVNQFYTRNKYKCIQSFFHGKRKMNLYYKKFDI